MFQRLSNLLFGDVEEVAADLKGPNPCVTEADEEGWMLVNLADSDCMMQVEDDVGTPLTAQASPDSKLADHQNTQTRTECPASMPRPPHKRRRPHKGQTRGPAAPSEPLSCPNASPPHLGATTPVSLPRRARLSTPSSTPSMSPGSGKGATAETSPMEDLLIEHPSMSVYVSPNNLSMLSSSNLSVVGEESIVSLASSASRVTEPAAPPATRSTMPTRVSRGAAAQAGALAKVTQVARVQRYKARMERRHLSRSHIQRQNRVREQVPRHASHARNTFLHQPSKRNFCH
ncbi:PREDICTED: tumor protein p53-inducible nuclear protein 2 isoform X2 [Poecilia mexicana]|uniref:Tumor protein p53 inducible nuclear protein 2 n=1 Tax=Poecilia mexicana TaxID=48701 RepID=A0A3B3WSQ6_9TELE|nr:PREDICTED: tumor protein p53-inducible nuclear protein 2 isoform X2 [Poecilia mexicana]XP_016529619.1 PREDICTED: tumor protein p53-inducible nuclear protein 2 isoform X2 [Poecilia formosa]